MSKLFHHDYPLSTEADRIDARVRGLAFISEVNRWETISQQRNNVLLGMNRLFPIVMDRLLESNKISHFTKYPFSTVIVQPFEQGLIVACTSLLNDASALYCFVPDVEQAGMVRFAAVQNPHLETAAWHGEDTVQSWRASAALEVADAIV